VGFFYWATAAVCGHFSQSRGLWNLTKHIAKYLVNSTKAGIWTFSQDGAAAAVKRSVALGRAGVTWYTGGKYKGGRSMALFREHWLKFVAAATTAAFSGALTLLWRRIRREVREQATLKTGVLALLHDRLYSACQLYIQYGKIALEDLENLEHLYKGYRDLGGNGACEAMYHRVEALPTDLSSAYHEYDGQLR
jgi:hypothetical protein